MNETPEELRLRYSQLSDRELVRLYDEGGLSETAEKVLVEMIWERGIDVSRVEEIEREKEAEAAAVAARRDSGELEGLGGWLILLQIGMWLSVLGYISLFITDYLPVLFGNEYQSLADPNSFDYIPFWKELIIVQVLGALALVSVNAVALYAFYTKKAAFPRLFIILRVAEVLLIVMIAMFANFIFEDGESIITTRLLRTIGTTVIWIGYLRISERVANTFVNPWRSTPKPQTV